MKRILVIRLSALGDVAMASITVRAFVQQFPTIELIIISKPFLKPLFADIENVTFHAVDTKNKHKGIIGIYKLYKELKKCKLDAIADLHNVLRSKILTFFFIGLKKSQIDKGRSEKKALTREKNKKFYQLKTSHQRYVDVFDSLGFKIDLSKVQLPKKIALPIDLRQLLEPLGQSKKYIGIAPFANYTSKTYPIDLMEKVIERLEKKYSVILFGGGAEQINQLTILEEKFKNVICIAGKISFNQELILISNLHCMISMDSANAHFAALYGIHTITIWGTTHPFAGFYPFNQPKENAILPDLIKYPKIPLSVFGNKEIPGYENLMRTIEPKTIVQKVEEILS
ncbi:glycosyltransferase family 9 protein [Polaribacter sp.]|uniref:glycosyltransferase family 9 protein n=1 Tax=Polaribacter sp. TaxID=1920175 RepID=UPI004048CCB6